MIFKQLNLYTWDDVLAVLVKDDKFYICLASDSDCIFDSHEISQNLYEALVNELGAATIEKPL